MYVYQDGKLYLQVGEQLVGVEIYPDKIISVEGTETTLADEYELFTKHEVRCKFHIEDSPYIFPKGEVGKDDTVRKAKTNTRKSTSK